VQSVANSLGALSERLGHSFPSAGPSVGAEV
jgi:hypothetical protein